MKKQSNIIIGNSSFQLWYKTGGSYDYQDMGDDSMWLPEIIVTPDGNYTRDEWDDVFGYDDNESDDYEFEFGVGGGGTDGGHMSQAEIIANGLQAVGLVEDSINNNTAIWLQKIQETNTYKAISVTSLVANAPGLQHDLIKALVKDPLVLNTWGKAFVKGNAIAGFATAVIGLADGDQTPGDWLIMAGAVAGSIGFVTQLCPVVSLSLTGVSILLTVVGTSMNESRGSSSY